MKSPKSRSQLLTLTDSYLRERFIYASENIETLLTPDYMLAGLEMTGNIVGDCDDISTLHAALLTCMDIPARFAAIKSTYGNSNYDHVYVEAKYGEEWVPFDITVPLGTNLENFGKFTIAI